MNSLHSSKNHIILYTLGISALIASCICAIYLALILTQVTLQSFAYYCLFLSSITIIGSVIATIYYLNPRNRDLAIAQINARDSEALKKFKDLYSNAGYSKIKKLINTRWVLRMLMVLILIFAFVVFKISALINNFGEAFVYAATFILIFGIVFCASSLLSGKIKKEYIEYENILEAILNEVRDFDSISNLIEFDVINAFKLYSLIFEDRKNCSQTANFGALEMHLDTSATNALNLKKNNPEVKTFIKNIFWFIFGSNHNPIEDSISKDDIIQKRFEIFLILTKEVGEVNLECYQQDLKLMQNDYNLKYLNQEHSFVNSIIRFTDKFSLDRYMHEFFV